MQDLFLPVLLQGAAVSSDGVLAWVLERVDVMAHLQASFLSGALDSGHVVFFAAWILAALFIAVRLVESKRWL